MLLDYITSNFITLALLVSMSLLVFHNRKADIPASGLFHIPILLIFAMTITTYVNELTGSALLDGTASDPELYRKIRFISADIEYILRPFPIYIELLLIIPDRRNKLLSFVPAGINTLVYLVALFVPQLVFGYHEDGHFYRGPLGLTVYTVQFAYLFLLMFFSARFFRKSNQRNISLIVMIVALALITAVFESNSILTGYANPIAAVCLLLYYAYLSTIHAEEIREQIAQQELRHARDNLSILRTQIQPHFILNSMSVIRFLAKTDQAKAVESIDLFSDYLKAHLNALRSDDMIPFEKELENVRAYLSLAQMDTSRNVRIEYDIKEMDFRLPALSLEPLVENAVKHGIGDKGGTVSVSTRTEDSQIIVEIRDTGSGKTHLTKAENERLGIGISNTRKRLALQCGGTLHEHYSENGSTVTVIIPIQRKESEHEYSDRR